jgi:hypothetical protein
MECCRFERSARRSTSCVRALREYFNGLDFDKIVLIKKPTNGRVCHESENSIQIFF